MTGPWVFGQVQPPRGAESLSIVQDLSTSTQAADRRAALNFSTLNQAFYRW